MRRQKTQRGGCFRPFEQLAQGGTVTVHIEDADGKEHTLDVSV